MLVAIFLCLALGLPWALPRLFPNQFRTVAIGLNFLSIVLLISVAGERGAEPVQWITMGIVVGGALTILLNKNKRLG